MRDSRFLPPNADAGSSFLLGAAEAAGLERYRLESYPVGHVLGTQNG